MFKWYQLSIHELTIFYICILDVLKLGFKKQWEIVMETIKNLISCYKMFSNLKLRKVLDTLIRFLTHLIPKKVKTHNFSRILINKCTTSRNVNFYLTYIQHNKSLVVVFLLKRTTFERNCFYIQHPSCRFVEYLRYFLKYGYEQYDLSTMGNSCTP